MTEPFTFRVPGAPPHDLSPNRNQGYGGPNKIKKITRLKGQMKATWGTAIVAERNNAGHFDPDTPMFRGKVVAEIVYGKAKGAKSWDPDNLIATVKVGLDQLQAQGIVANDRYLDPVVKDQVRDPDGVGYVEITVREAA